MDDGPHRNALTIDVEDYFHASAFRRSIPYSQWDYMDSRVERTTHAVLEMLEEFHLSATFFVLGWVAERHPSLIRAIRAAGHELGCHSYAHRLVYELTPDEFRADTRRALSAIENAVGLRVQAYRAPSFSITGRSLWALEVLLELGFTIDSSIFPTWNWLYGIPNAPRHPFRIRVNGADILEFPPATLRIGRWNIPVTGGAYLRLLPYSFQTRALKSLADRRDPILLYFHPWELDPGQPRVPAALDARFYHYTRLDQTERLLRGLFSRFSFGKLSEAARNSPAAFQVKLAGRSRVVFSAPST